MQLKNRKILSEEQLVQGVLTGDKAILAQAITLIESSHPDHQKKAQQILTQLLPHSGKSLRIGISGIPGVGKSTFIESFGKKLIDDYHHRLAVLAVDPSSSLTGGSILGDKTRMTELSHREEAYIRPTPSRGTLGGVAQKTRETIYLCEAAGMDRILVETVGVGQSETVVADMVDLFMVLLLPGAGDELQGIKRGILEVADILVIHKADGENKQKAKIAALEYERALRILQGSQMAENDWLPPVLMCSSTTGEGLKEVAEAVENFLLMKKNNHLFQKKREEQQKKWLWDLIQHELINRFKSHPPTQQLYHQLEKDVMTGKLSAQSAAQTLLKNYA